MGTVRKTNNHLRYQKQPHFSEKTNTQKKLKLICLRYPKAHIVTYAFAVHIVHCKSKIVFFFFKVTGRKTDKQAAPQHV